MVSPDERWIGILIRSLFDFAPPSVRSEGLCVHCRECGSLYASIGRDYLACPQIPNLRVGSNPLGVANQTKGLREITPKRI